MGCMCACVRCASSGFAAAQRHVCGATLLRPSPFTHGPCRLVTCHHSARALPCPGGPRPSRLAYYGSTHPGAHLLPLRARHGQRLRAPRPPATAWRLLGGLLCRGSADAPAPYAAERSRGRCAPQATRGRRAATRACTGMQALHGASATRCGSGGCRRGGATHAAVDQRERALILSAEMAVNSECVPRAEEVLGSGRALFPRTRPNFGPKSAVKSADVR